RCLRSSWTFLVNPRSRAGAGDNIIRQPFQNLARKPAIGRTALTSTPVEHESFHAQASLPEQSHLVIATFIGTRGRTLAADLDFAPPVVDLNNLERFHQVRN